jgi:hypothetical protein
MDTDSDEGESDDYADYDETDDFAQLRDSTAYWRRRFIVLAAGVAARGLCVWLFPGDHPAAAGTSASARASTAALASGSALPSAAYGVAWPGPEAAASAAPGPSASTSPKPAAAKPAKHRKTRKPGVGYHPSTAAATLAGERRCAPAAIVLSLFTSQAVYTQGEQPSFSVYAVSTSTTACALAYGPGSVHVVVTRDGRVVWNSAACKPPAARPVRFTLGVPQVLTLPWNRHATSPSGCAGSLSANAWGTFDAVAMTPGQSSPVRSFKLGR